MIPFIVSHSIIIIINIIVINLLLSSVDFISRISFFTSLFVLFLKFNYLFFFCHYCNIKIFHSIFFYIFHIHTVFFTCEYIGIVSLEK